MFEGFLSGSCVIYMTAVRVSSVSSFVFGAELATKKESKASDCWVRANMLTFELEDLDLLSKIKTLYTS